MRLKKSDNIWLSYVIWVAFILAMMAFIAHQAIPVLEHIQFANEVKKASNLLSKIKNDVELLKYSAYGSELKYYLNFKDSYLVCNENSSELQLWIKLKGSFNKNWVSKGVDAKVDYDFLILSVDLNEKILNDLSAKAEGNFFIRNKGEGVIITNKKGIAVNVNSTIKPALDPYLSWIYNASFFYKGFKWEDIWLTVKDNYSFVEKEIYAFENLNKSVLLNFSGLNNNKSSLVLLNYNLTTDFGNYFNGKNYLEVPFNRRVNLTIYFNNVEKASLALNFEYLGKKWDINFGDIECINMAVVGLSCLNNPLDNVCYNISIKKNRDFTCNITFNVYNLPTYTNYSIEWSYKDVSGNKDDGTTWRIFTPYIWACDSSGSSLNCDSNYWVTEGTYKNNNFYYENKKITTQYSLFYKKWGINDYSKKCYVWENNKIEINGKNLGETLYDC